MNRGIYLLPNLMTTLALFAGFYGVVAGMKGHFETGAMAIFVAMIFDGLDGRIARMTNATSDFGAEYDSLADMVSFGAAPALLAYQWALTDLGKIGWLVAFIYTAAAALRLARFNTQVGTMDKRYFQGLPSPAAAAIVAGLIWVSESQAIVLPDILVLAVTLASGLLMVSNIRYPSFKELQIKHRVSFVFLLLAVLTLVFIMLQPPVILFSLFAGYGTYGLLMTLWQYRALKSAKKNRHLNKDHPENKEPS